MKAGSCIWKRALNDALRKINERIGVKFFLPKIKPARAFARAGALISS
jgi:hypothetical protein